MFAEFRADGLFYRGESELADLIAQPAQAAEGREQAREGLHDIAARVVEEEHRGGLPGHFLALFEEQLVGVLPGAVGGGYHDVEFRALQQFLRYGAFVQGRVFHEHHVGLGERNFAFGVVDEVLRSLRRKELAMVFQHFGLMPHYTVLQNIAFGLELQGQEKREREQKAAESMRLVGLDGYADLMVNELSGGMQQRVGLARALANDPEVLLMDEAFSALDPLIRVQMQDELLALQSKVKKTIVFITHDLEEAVKLGDRIAIMRDGEIQQIGTSEEILTDPANKYVRCFVENVDRSRIITAASIMVDKPMVARQGKEGPEVLIRKMRERKITVLPVVDPDGILVGEVHLKELIQLRKERILNIDSIVRKEVHSILGDTVVEDILPLMTKTNSPIWVVNEKREFEGMVPLSSLIIEVTGKDKEEINEIIQNAIEL